MSEKRFDVTLCGELNLDLILYGLPEDLPLEREVLCDNMALTLGSSSAILAHNLAKLGTRVGFHSSIGTDRLGQVAIDWLAAAGVDVRRAGQPLQSSGLTVVLQHQKRRRMVTYLGAIAEMAWEDLDLNYLTSARHFHMSSYFLHQRLRPHIAELFRHVKQAGLTTSLDTNDDPEDRWGDELHAVLRHVDVLLPNEREALRIAGVNDFARAMDRLAVEVPLVVVKRGAAGALARRGSETLTRDAVPVEVVDAVGAGDSFNAGFLHQYLQGAGLSVCLEFANQVAAKSLTRAGGTTAFREAT